MEARELIAALVVAAMVLLWIQHEFINAPVMPDDEEILREIQIAKEIDKERAA